MALSLVPPRHNRRVASASSRWNRSSYGVCGSLGGLDLELALAGARSAESSRTGSVVAVGDQGMDE